MTQIPLRINLRSPSSFANYLVGPNAAAVNAVQRFAGGDLDSTCLFLWGGSGTGKSHLVEAALQTANFSKRSCVYLALRNDSSLLSDALEGLESLGLVVVDDIDCVAGELDWEHAFFRLYNRCESKKSAQLMITSRSPLRKTPFVLRDLSSRLSSGPVFQLKELSESDRVVAIKRRARERGYEMPDDVCNFLLKRSRRDMHTLANHLATIERLTLERKSPVTISVIKAALE